MPDLFPSQIYLPAGQATNVVKDSTGRCWEITGFVEQTEAIPIEDLNTYEIIDQKVCCEMCNAYDLFGDIELSDESYSVEDYGSGLESTSLPTTSVSESIPYDGYYGYGYYGYGDSEDQSTSDGDSTSGGGGGGSDEDTSTSLPGGGGGEGENPCSPDCECITFTAGWGFTKEECEVLADSKGDPCGECGDGSWEFCDPEKWFEFDNDLGVGIWTCGFCCDSIPSEESTPVPPEESTPGGGSTSESTSESTSATFDFNFTEPPPTIVIRDYDFTFTGEVVDENGDPIESYDGEVEIEILYGDPLDVFDSTGTTTVTVTVEDGEFTFEDFISGGSGTSLDMQLQISCDDLGISEVYDCPVPQLGFYSSYGFSGGDCHSLGDYTLGKLSIASDNCDADTTVGSENYASVGEYDTETGGSNANISRGGLKLTGLTGVQHAGIVIKFSSSCGPAHATTYYVKCSSTPPGSGSAMKGGTTISSVTMTAGGSTASGSIVNIVDVTPYISGDDLYVWLVHSMDMSGNFPDPLDYQYYTPTGAGTGWTERIQIEEAYFTF